MDIDINKEMFETLIKISDKTIGINLQTEDEAIKSINNVLKNYGLEIDFSNRFSPSLKKLM